MFLFAVLGFLNNVEYTFVTVMLFLLSGRVLVCLLEWQEGFFLARRFPGERRYGLQQTSVLRWWT